MTTIETLEKPLLVGAEHQPSPEEVASAFAQAGNTLAKITLHPRFISTLMKRGIAPDAMDSVDYWRTASEFADDLVARARDNRGDQLDLYALELAAATPAALMSQYKLDATDNNNHRDTAAFKSVSNFNSKLRHFIGSFPTVPSNTLATGLLNTANRTIEDPHLKRQSPEIVTRCIRGMQHEAGFGKILEYTGRQYRGATSREDSQGIDYIVGGTTGHELHIDVKASQKEMIRLGAGDSPYAFRTNNTIAMNSLIRDAEFHGRLGLSDEIAEKKAPVLDELLSHAEAGRVIKIGSTALREVV